MTRAQLILERDPCDEKIGGRVEVTSTANDTTFSVQLPHSASCPLDTKPRAR